MNHSISNEIKALILFLVFVSSSHCLHWRTKRYQIPSTEQKSGQSEPRPVRDSILDRFRINPNTIIRTHDSRALGAKYLNETELSSNEDCLYWCWQTSPCNLAVYEQKSRGSCYLFDCGSSEDFKCKFTAHNFYSSSILQVNRHPYDLSQWGSQVQHEKELTKLRSGGQYIEMTAAPVSRSTPPSSRNIAPPLPMVTTTPTPSVTHKTSHCLHYQFECRNNSECIAIYNVCDGIPQCSDGSDESVDLECHKSRFNVPNTKPIGPPVDSNASPSSQKLESKSFPKDKLNPIYSRIAESKSPQPMPAFNYPKTANSESGRTRDEQAKKTNPIQTEDSNLKNGYNSQYRGPWNAYYPQNEVYNSGDNRANGLSGSGYVVEPEYLNNYNRDNTNSGSYWPTLGRQHSYDLSDQMLSPGSQNYVGNKGQTNSGDEWPQMNSNANYDSNYYDRISKLRASKAEPNANSYAQQMSSDLKYFSNSKSNKIESNGKSKSNAGQSKPETKVQMQTVSGKLWDKPNVSYSHVSSNRGYAPSAGVIAVSYMQDSSQQSGRETNSAVIALSLGLCVTALLIVLVGCRMKSFKRKIARRGRPLAHDADYLVNGMYL